MPNNTAKIIGIVEASPLPEERKALYREMLKKEGATAATVEAIKSDLRGLIAEKFVAAGGELDPNDPDLKKAEAESAQALQSVQDRYIATMKDLEERIDKVMGDAQTEIDKLDANLAKEELTA